MSQLCRKVWRFFSDIRSKRSILRSAFTDVCLTHRAAFPSDGYSNRGHSSYLSPRLAACGRKSPACERCAFCFLTKGRGSCISTTVECSGIAIMRSAGVFGSQRTETPFAASRSAESDLRHASKLCSEPLLAMPIGKTKACDMRFFVIVHWHHPITFLVQCCGS